jgi:hypothetical protein
VPQKLKIYTGMLLDYQKGESMIKEDFPGNRVNIVIIGAMLVISACTPDECRSFPQNINQSGHLTSWVSNNEYNDRVIRKSKYEIDQCYRKVSYFRPSSEPAFLGLGKDRHGKILIVYDFLNITDVRVAFVIDNDGNIVDAFEYSTL